MVIVKEVGTTATDEAFGGGTVQLNAKDPTMMAVASVEQNLPTLVIAAAFGRGRRASSFGSATEATPSTLEFHPQALATISRMNVAPMTPPHAHILEWQSRAD
jgi:hypothetical protein